MAKFTPLGEDEEEFDSDPTAVLDDEDEEEADLQAGLEDDELIERQDEVAEDVPAPAATPEPEESFTPLPDGSEEVEPKGVFETLADEALGLLEGGLSLGASAAGDVLGGLGGAVKTITSGPEEGEKTLRAIQDKFSFDLQTETGKRNAQGIGKFFNEVIKMDDANNLPIIHPLRQIFSQEDNVIGNFMADVARQTGSETLEAFAGAFGSSLAPGALEILGFKGAGKLSRGTGLKKKRASDAAADAELQKSIPSAEKFIETAKGVFKETDRAGAIIKQSEMPNLARRVRESLQEGGYLPRVNPSEPIERLLAQLDSGVPLSTAEMRQLAQGISKLGGPGTHEAALGLGIRATMDDFMGMRDVLDLPAGTSPQVAEAYRVARKMYGQGKRSQFIGKLIENASTEGKDFIQKMNTQMNALIQKQVLGKGEGRFFSKADRKIMESMVADTKGQKFLQNLSKMSPFRNNAGGLITILTGVGASTSAAVTGSVAASGLVAIPVIVGELAAVYGKKLFTSKANMGNAMIRAGSDGRKIARAYFEHVPKAQRNTDDLARMLLDPNIDASDLPKTNFTREAMQKADQIRKERLAAGGAAASTGLVTEEE